MAGHLFIVRGDLTRLCCDAALIPSGLGLEGGGQVMPHWKLDGRRGIRPASAAEGGWYAEESPTERKERVVALPASPPIARTRGPQGRETWIAHTGESGHGDDPEWFVRPVLEFLRTACAAGAAVTGRELPLLAFPLVGSGQGGIAHDKGRLMQVLINGVCDSISEPGISADAVLVTDDAEAFAAAQHVRARRDDSWAELNEGSPLNGTALSETTARLAQRARSDRLVLFMGAGVSAGAGLPDWEGLLAELERRVSEPSLGGSHLDALDRAELIARKLAEQEVDLRAALLAAIGESDAVSLQHQLLASLPVTEAATTNYDELFEFAWLDALYPSRLRPEWNSEARRKEIAVLPDDDARSAKRWLLKLHGSLGSKRQPIVLTRGDYLRFERDSSALAGLVQAMLVTREILFVGYSLSDPNFQRIVYDVRTVLGGAKEAGSSGAKFGTVLTPVEPGPRRDLWSGEIEFVSTCASAEFDAGPTADAIRTIEVVLDRVLSEAAVPVAYLHDSTYGALLTDSEIDVMDALKRAQELAATTEGVLAEALGNALVELQPSASRDWRRDSRVATSPE